MESDDRSKTVKQLEDELSATKVQLDHAVREILHARADLETQKTRSSLFQEAASKMKLQFEGTKLELEKMAQLKMGRQELQDRIDLLTSQLENAKNRISELELSNKVLSEARDENSKTYSEMRDKIFELECGADERIASAEGQVLFYKARLTKVLRSVRDILELW